MRDIELELDILVNESGHGSKYESINILSVNIIGHAVIVKRN